MFFYLEGIMTIWKILQNFCTVLIIIELFFILLYFIIIIILNNKIIKKDKYNEINNRYIKNSKKK